MVDPRRVRTRRLLVEAGHRLIAEKGFAGLRIAEITEEAGIALGSFYTHFETKEQLVEAVVSETLAALAAEIVENPDATDGSDAATVAIRALRRFVRLAYEEPEFARVVVNLGNGDELFLDAVAPYARTALQRAVDDGLFVIDDVEVVVATVVTGALGVIRAILDGRLGEDADVAVARFSLAGFHVSAGEAERIATEPLHRNTETAPTGGA